MGPLERRENRTPMTPMEFCATKATSAPYFVSLVDISQVSETAQRCPGIIFCLNDTGLWPAQRVRLSIGGGAAIFFFECVG